MVKESGMRNSGFKKPTYQEALEKRKSKTTSQNALGRKKPLKAKRIGVGISDKTYPHRLKPSKWNKGKPSQAKLKKKFDAIFSQFIRRKYADENGMVKCYTCTTIKHWKEIQNGHWIPRNNLATRFSEDNCRPQCVGCNMFQKGMPDVFAVNLIKEGIDIVALQQTRYSIFKIDRQWYLDKIVYYENLIK